MRSDERKRLINIKVRNSVKIALKTFKEKPSLENLSKAYSALDRAVKKNVIPKNRSSRKKSQLSILVTSKTPKPTGTKSKSKTSTKN